MFTVANLCIIYDRIVVTAKLNASKQALLKNYESRVKLIPPPPPNLSHIFHLSNFPTQHCDIYRTDFRLSIIIFACEDTCLLFQIKDLLSRGLRVQICGSARSLDLKGLDVTWRLRTTRPCMIPYAPWDWSECCWHYWHYVS